MWCLTRLLLLQVGQSALDSFCLRRENVSHLALLTVVAACCCFIQHLTSHSRKHTPLCNTLRVPKTQFGTAMRPRYAIYSPTGIRRKHRWHPQTPSMQPCTRRLLPLSPFPLLLFEHISSIFIIPLSRPPPSCFPPPSFSRVLGAPTWSETASVIPILMTCGNGRGLAR